MSLVFKVTQESLPLNSQEIASRRASSILDSMSGKLCCWIVNIVTWIFPSTSLRSWVWPWRPLVDDPKCTEAPYSLPMSGCLGRFPAPQGLSLSGQSNLFSAFSQGLICRRALLRGTALLPHSATSIQSWPSACYVSWVGWREALPEGSRMIWRASWWDEVWEQYFLLEDSCEKSVVYVFMTLVLEAGRAIGICQRWDVRSSVKENLSKHLTPHSVLYDMEIKIIALESRLLGFKSWFLHLLAVWPWASYFISLNMSFLIWKTVSCSLSREQWNHAYIKHYLLCAQQMFVVIIILIIFIPSLIVHTFLTSLLSLSSMRKELWN